VNTTRPAAVVVLAAGQGTRMKTSIPKVLQPMCGRSLLEHAIAAARQATATATLSPEARASRRATPSESAEVQRRALNSASSESRRAARSAAVGSCRRSPPRWQPVATAPTIRHHSTPSHARSVVVLRLRSMVVILSIDSVRLLTSSGKTSFVAFRNCLEFIRVETGPG